MAAPTLPVFKPTFKPTQEQIDIQVARARYVIALAAAGAAKTTTAALRAAESIRRGVAPEHILVLTFSAVAAEAFKKKLIEIGLDKRSAKAVRCVTFETFAKETLFGLEGRAPAYFGAIETIAPKVREAIEAMYERDSDLFRTDDLWLPEHNEQIDEFLGQVLMMKGKMVKPELNPDSEEDTFEQRAVDHSLPIGFFRLYRQFEQDRTRHCTDVQWRTEFDATFDLASMLSDPYQNVTLPRYRIVIVDELQDMTPASYMVLKHLLEQNGAFFTGVGDFDQIINRWAGADIEFMHYTFGADWTNVLRLPLTQTWRYGPPLAEANSAQKHKKIVSARAHDTRIELRAYADHQHAGELIVADLQDWAAREGSLSDCAIILRAPEQSVYIENALFEGGIGARIEGMTSYLMRSEVLMLRGVMAFALNDYASVPDEDKRLQVLQALLLWQQLGWSDSRIHDADLKLATRDATIFNAFLEGVLLKPQTAADQKAAKMTSEEQLQADLRLQKRIMSLTRESRHEEADILRQLVKKEGETVVESPAQHNARIRLVRAIEALQAAPEDEPADQSLLRAVKLLDLAGTARQLFINPNAARTVVRSIRGFLDAARRFGQPLRAFAMWLRENEAKAMNLSSSMREKTTVHLRTVEAAKGQEFRMVMVPFLERGLFPMDGFSAEEESNRFYVATTRTRDELRMYVPDNSQLVSRFVGDMNLKKARAQGRFLLGEMQPRI